MNIYYKIQDKNNINKKDKPLLLLNYQIDGENKNPHPENQKTY